jgi:hypothetical protein
MGFDRVFDTSFHGRPDHHGGSLGAGQAAMTRQGAVLPMITSPAPRAGSSLSSTFYPEFTPEPLHLQESAADAGGADQVGVRTRSKGLDPQNIFSVSYHALHGKEI